jgi:hypothetical protein
MKWPTAADRAATSERPPIETHELDVYLVEDRAVDVCVDGASVFPTWFKLEFKETGEVSAKIKGFRLSSRGGDAIRIHQGPPTE